MNPREIIIHKMKGKGIENEQKYREECRWFN